MSNYSEKLKHPKWQKKRLEIMQRDDFKCKLCNDTETMLHVHHLLYSKEPWDVGDKFLVTLCEDCHEIVETVKNSNKDFNFSEIEIIKVGEINNDLFFIRYKNNIIIQSGNNTHYMDSPYIYMLSELNERSIEYLKNS